MEKIVICLALCIGLIGSAAAQKGGGKPGGGGGKKTSIAYTIIEISPPQSLLSDCLPDYQIAVEPADLNNNGVVIATVNCYVQSPIEAEPLYQYQGSLIVDPISGSRIVDNPYGGGPKTVYALDINDSDEFTGTLEANYTADGCEGSSPRAFIGSLQSPPSLLFTDNSCESGSFEFGRGINNSGEIIGWGLNQEFKIVNFRLAASGEYSEIDYFPMSNGFNNEGIQTGYRNAVPYGIFLWRRDNTLEEWSIEEPAASLYYTSYGLRQLSDSGKQVGWVSYVNPETQCFEDTVNSGAKVWAEGSETTLPNLSGFRVGAALGINDAEVIVGYSTIRNRCLDEPAYLSDENRFAMRWENGSVYDLNKTIPKRSNVQLVWAVRVNNSGQILAQGFPASEEPLKCLKLIDCTENPASQCPAEDFCHSKKTYLLAPK